jgi:hypothetical protein
LVANDKTGLLGARPAGDTAIINDLPNERGELQKQFGDNHDTVTGSNKQGMLASTALGSTCNDWTSAVGSTGKPFIGHSWPRSANNGTHWISDHQTNGCAPGVNLNQDGAGTGDCIGCGGGYGGLYCFALTP